MTLIDRLTDLVGCTVVLVDPESGHVVFWSGEKAFLRFQVRDGVLVEDGLWWSQSKPSGLESARALASLATYR